MPSHSTAAPQAQSHGDTMLSAVVEEEADLYDAFPPHVDPTGITILSESPPGLVYFFTVFHIIIS